MKLITVILLAAITLFGVSCTKEMSETFGEMFVLSSKLNERFGESSPNISIGEKGIAVTFVNSPFNDLPPEEKKAKAREIALFVKDNYSKIERIETITVVFGIHKNYVIFQYTDNFDGHFFKVKELSADSKQNKQN